MSFVSRHENSKIIALRGVASSLSLESVMHLEIISRQKLRGRYFATPCPKKRCNGRNAETLFETAVQNCRQQRPGRFCHSCCRRYRFIMRNVKSNLRTRRLHRTGCLTSLGVTLESQKRFSLFICVFLSDGASLRSPYLNDPMYLETSDGHKNYRLASFIVS